MSCLELVTQKSMILGHWLTAFTQMPLMRKTLSWTTFLLGNAFPCGHLALLLTGLAISKDSLRRVIELKKHFWKWHSFLASYPVVGYFLTIGRRFPGLARNLVPSCDNRREGIAFFLSFSPLAWSKQKSHYQLWFPRNASRRSTIYFFLIR